MNYHIFKIKTRIHILIIRKKIKVKLHKSWDTFFSLREHTLKLKKGLNFDINVNNFPWYHFVTIFKTVWRLGPSTSREIKRNSIWQDNDSKWHHQGHSSAVHDIASRNCSKLYKTFPSHPSRLCHAFLTSLHYDIVHLWRFIFLFPEKS